MPLYFEYECPLGHQLYEDDKGWCPSCMVEVRPLRMTHDAAAMTMTENIKDDAMNVAEPFDNRLKDLFYGFNDDAIYGINGDSGHDNNRSAAEDATSAPMHISLDPMSMHLW